jgi:hypothetical protein
MAWLSVGRQDKELWHHSEELDQLSRSFSSTFPTRGGGIVTFVETSCLQELPVCISYGMLGDHYLFQWNPDRGWLDQSELPICTICDLVMPTD